MALRWVNQSVKVTMVCSSMEQLFKASSRTFFQYGGQHAPFLTFLGLTTGGVYVLGSRGRGWADEARVVKAEPTKEIATLEARLDKETATREAQAAQARAQIAQARAEAIHETSE